MSTEVAPTQDAPAAAVIVAADAPAPIQDEIQCAKPPAPNFLHSPPDSNNAPKSDGSDSELSDLDEEPVLGDAPHMATAPAPAPEDAKGEEEEKDDIGEVLPDHWSGAVPVFKPEMHQFKDFKRFMEKVDSYGMKSGIIKIIPPREWKDSLPQLDDLVKRVKVREPIKQDIMGSNGTYRQVNILHGRSYNIPQWRQLCEQSEHQPPARRGERRANAEKPKATRTRPAASKPANSSTPKPRGRGRPPKGRGKGKAKVKKEDEEDRPMTPVSPRPETEETPNKAMASIEKELGEEVDEDQDVTPTVGRMGGSRQARAKVQSISARRKYSRREGSAMIDEEAFKDFDYRMDISEYTPERCEELERAYWKTLTYAQPLYGADLMGTLFDENTELWNLNKLPNLLDVLGTKVPGVNTAYLYLGMWKATFAWHLEDVDLYSINYLHFGAPKQWYSISQADARRFEQAMKSVWPTDAKACDQFLRHKAFLISPQHLLSNYGIKVNKCVSYPGEFVVTYPYGYHSGYNLGYNCAEAVNFALDSWLEMGKIAKKCECAQAQDSVWVDVYEIERKLRGEETEYEETEEEDDEDEDDDEMSGLPTPPASHGVKFKHSSRKRKRGPGEKVGKKVKKIKLRINSKAEPPCCLCPNDFSAAELLPTDDGRKAHRMCALYLPETYIDTVDGKEIVSNVARIHKDRLELKCLYCRSKRGACFQCSQKKCARAYHATCAHAAGVFVEEEEVPVFGEDGTEYKEQAFEFSCRFHRTKRDKRLDGESLEDDARTMAAARVLKQGDICQLQYFRSEIFAGVIVENRAQEQTLLVDVIPNGERLEVEWKWLLLADPADHHLPKASANALPMPTSRKAKDELNAKRPEDDRPRKGDRFGDGHTWAEFNTGEVQNKDQVKIDFAKPDQIWYYLGKTSTEAKAQFTEDPLKRRHNPKGNFMETLPKPPRPAPISSTPRQQVYRATGTYNGGHANGHQYNGAQYGTTSTMNLTTGRPQQQKPYVYKPRKPIEPQYGNTNTFTAQRFTPTASASPAPASQGPTYQHYQYNPTGGYQNGNTYSTQHFEVKPLQAYSPQQHSTTSTPMPLPQVSQPQPQPQQQQQQQGSSLAYNSSQAPPPPPAPTPSQQQTNLSWQVHSSIYRKYEFFYVHYNRDSAKYRTPYSPYGGFINGYQGNLRAHLMANQGDLLRRASFNSMTAPQPVTTPTAQHQYGYYHEVGGALQPSGTLHSPQQVAGLVPQGRQGMDPLPTAPNTKDMPAIKAKYLPKEYVFQHQFTQQQTPLPPKGKTTKKKKLTASKPALTEATFDAGSSHMSGSTQLSTASSTANPSSATAIVPQPPVSGSGSTSTPAQKSYKAPPKVSPVPLPANFLAAMTGSPMTPTTLVKQSSPQGTYKQPAGADADTRASTPASVKTQVASTIGSPAKKSQSNTPKICTPVTSTPIPIPKLPGMSAPHNQTLPTSASQVQAIVALMPQASPTQQGTDQGNKNEPQAQGKQPSKALQITTIGLGITQPAFHQPAPQVTERQSAENVPHAQLPEPEGFPDVPGSGSMEFVERMMQNLRKVSQHGDAV